MSFMLSWFEPAYNALNPFNSLPFTYRWRLLIFQPIALLINTIKYLPYLFTHRYTIIHIPTRTGNRLRTLVFHPPAPKTPNPPHALAPLHLTLHAGGFMGGIPEYNAPFALALAASTGAIVVAPTYRFAPLHPFPAAADDIADVLAWLLAHAPRALRADPALLTMSGFSAGANLALGAAQSCSEGVVKGAVTFYAPVDLRTPANHKPRPPGLPERDPIAAILPLADSYAGSGAVREEYKTDPRLHPILADVWSFPERMLFVIPTVDILLHEQLVLVERLRREISESGDDGRVVETLVVEGQMHGWVELPSFMIDKKTADDAFGAAIEFFRETHRQHGWD